jgi:hypothetical protein
MNAVIDPDMVDLKEQVIEVKVLLAANTLRLDEIERKVAKMDATYASVERLDHLADALDRVSTVMNKGKKWWLAFGSLVTATLVIINLLSRLIANLPWP